MGSQVATCGGSTFPQRMVFCMYSVRYKNRGELSTETLQRSLIHFHLALRAFLLLAWKKPKDGVQVAYKRPKKEGKRQQIIYIKPKRVCTEFSADKHPIAPQLPPFPPTATSSALDFTADP